MKRIITTPRPNWEQKMADVGMTYHTGGKPPSDELFGTYWREDAFWEFTAKEVDTIEAATNELQQLFHNAAEYIIEKRPDYMDKMMIPKAYQGLIIDSWNNDAPTVYGRMDLAYDGVNPPKLLEYNSDTPTLLVESSVAQWYWLKDKFGESGDQFNSIHERLIKAWEHVGEFTFDHVMYFAGCAQSLEEFSTVEYLRDTAQQAGLTTAFIKMEDIGWDGYDFVDLDDNIIKYLFKLYPWEWLWEEQFGEHIPVCSHRTGILEPPWKMLSTTKAILPLLWELNPDHPNLLPTFWDKPADVTGFYAKPIYSREGQNIDYYEKANVVIKRDGEYTAPKIWQKGANTIVGDKHVMIGSWVINCEAGGMIVREDVHPIIQDRSAVLPHRLV